MSISQTCVVQANAVGDGSSDTLVWDFSQQIAADKFISRRVPVSVVLITANSGPAPTSSAISGTIATFTWSAAPSAGTTIGLLVTLGF